MDQSEKPSLRPSSRLRIAQFSISFLLVAPTIGFVFRNSLVDASLNPIIWFSVLALIGLWRRVRWGWSMSQLMGVISLLPLIGMLVPTINDDKGLNNGMLGSISSEVSSIVILGAGLLVIALVALLTRQRDQFRKAMW